MQVGEERLEQEVGRASQLLPELIGKPGKGFKERKTWPD